MGITPAFDLALPTEDAGTTPLTTPARDEYWIRRLFERAVAGFYSVELSARGWGVRSGVRLHWSIAAPSKGISAILPSMKADIVLDAPTGRRIVIDTKFAEIIGKGWYREESLKSSYLYQIYAYLRSQERPGDESSPWNHAAGILLHPAIDKSFDESVTIQGHEMRFVTVDLSDGHQAIRSALREIALSMTEVRIGSPE